jgi:hypothetical protein
MALQLASLRIGCMCLSLAFERNQEDRVKKTTKTVPGFPGRSRACHCVAFAVSLLRIPAFAHAASNYYGHAIFDSSLTSDR